MPRKKHPNKHIEEALQYAELRGRRIEKSAGLLPRNPPQHARDIKRVIDGCVMIEENNDE